MSNAAIGKNIAETEYLLLPILKQAKNKWIEQANLINALRDNIQSLNTTLYNIYEEEVNKYKGYFVNDKETDYEETNPLRM